MERRTIDRIAVTGGLQPADKRGSLILALQGDQHLRPWPENPRVMAVRSDLVEEIECLLP